MNKAFLITLALIVAACGIQRPLIRPADIPAWEKKRAEKLEKRRIEVDPAPMTTQAP